MKHKRRLATVAASMCVVTVYFILVYNNLRIAENNSASFIRQTDPHLLDHIRHHVVIPPSNLPYQGFDNNTIMFSEMKIEALLAKLFRGKRHGVFVEAGGYDGSSASNTLFLEKYLHWSGLLIEPIPDFVEKIKMKHRHAWLAPACLSNTSYTKKVNFSMLEQMSHESDSDIMHYSLYLCEGREDTVIVFHSKNEQVTPGYSNCVERPHYTVACYPLYSLLLACGLTNVDFLSLDIEGNEMLVLQTLPFDKLEIEVIMVEVNKLADKSVMMDFMEKQGYIRVTKFDKYDLTEWLENDVVFMKNS